MHIASVTRSVPYDGIPHAGGDYVLRHAQALRELGHMLTFIAPDTDENRRATARGVPADAVVLYPARSLSHPGPVERLTRRLSPARVGRDEHRGLSRSAGARAALATADVVEYQWTQAADLGGVVARFAAPHARTMLVLHDVMTQQVTRQRDGGRGGLPARAIRSLKVALVRRAERRAISRVDTAVVFSEKDAAMARTLAPPAVVVEVVRPPSGRRRRRRHASRRRRTRRFPPVRGALRRVVPPRRQRPCRALAVSRGVAPHSRGAPRRAPHPRGGGSDRRDAGSGITRLRH